MDLNLKGHVAFISGGSQGIGRACAVELAREGADVVIFARSKGPLEECKKAVEAEGRKCLAISGDVMSDDDMNRAAKEALDAFGKIDILVNNAGWAGRWVTAEQLTPKEYRDLYQFNLVSGVVFTQAFLPKMVEQKWGRIIFINSGAGVQPESWRSHYAVTKAGQIALMKSLTLSHSRFGITVNSVSPGPIQTPAWEKAKEYGLDIQIILNAIDQNPELLPAGILGEAEDISGMVTYLASDRGKFVTGANIMVDGGWVKGY